MPASRKMRRSGHRAARLLGPRLLLLIALLGALGLVGVQGATPQRAKAAGNTLVVKNTDSSGAGSLRRAINVANNDDTIVFDPDVFDPAGGPYTIATGALGDLTIDKSISIIGPGPDVLTITANGGSRVFEVGRNVLSGCDHVEISGLAIRFGTSLTTGGGINTSGCPTVILDNLLIANNSAAAGGGIHTSGRTTLTIRNSLVTSNIATIKGGGMVYQGTSSGGGVSNTTFSDNSAPSGAAIVVQGEGIALGAQMGMGHSTIANNATGNTDSGALFIGDAGALFMSTTVFAGNSGANLAMSADAPGMVSSGDNISDDNSASANFTYLGDLNNVDPLLGPLADNGGPTRTHALLAGSPAIDSHFCLTENDQRGVPRPQGTDCDSGAFELEVPVAPAATFLSAHTATGVYGGITNLRASLKSNGVPVPGKPIVFSLKRGLNTIQVCDNAAGGYPAACPMTTSSGLANLLDVRLPISSPSFNAGIEVDGVIAAFAGDSSFEASTDTAAFGILRADTSVVAADKTVTYGTAPVQLTATVSNTSTYPAGITPPVPDEGAVIFKVRQGSTDIATVSDPLINNGSAAANLNLSGILPGSYDLFAQYSGFTNFNASTNETDLGTLTIGKADINLGVTSHTLPYGTASVTIQATLQNTSNSAALTGGTVSISVGSGGSVCTSGALAVPTGAASATVSFACTLGTTPVGTYPIAASYSGDDNFKASSASGSLTLTKSSTTTAPQNVTAIYSSANVLLAAVVTNSAVPGSPIGEGTVTFTIKQGVVVIGNPVSGAVVGGTASASFPLRLNINAGTYSVLANYSGTGNLNASNGGPATLTVAKAPTQFTQVKLDSTYGGTTGTLAATLTRNGGDNGPIGGAPVVFRVNGVQVCGLAGKPACPVTSAQGAVTLANVAVPSAGQPGGSVPNVVEASYAGDANHLPTTRLGAWQIARKILWVKPTNRTVGLGQPNPPTTAPANCLATQTPTSACWLELANGSTFVNGDDWADLNLTQLRFQYSRNPPGTNASESVGKAYTITAFGVTSSSYDVRYVSGTLTVVGP